MNELIADTISSEEFLTTLINACIEVYTEEELKDLIAFYESSTGKMYLKKTRIMAETIISESGKLINDFSTKKKSIDIDLRKDIEEYLIEIGNNDKSDGYLFEWFVTVNSCKTYDQKLLSVMALADIKIDAPQNPTKSVMSE